MEKYKSVEDYVDVATVPKGWTGYENPHVTVTLKSDQADDFAIRVLKSCIGEALLRYSSMTQRPMVREVKP